MKRQYSGQRKRERKHNYIQKYDYDRNSRYRDRDNCQDRCGDEIITEETNHGMTMKEIDPLAERDHMMEMIHTVDTGHGTAMIQIDPITKIDHIVKIDHEITMKDPLP